MKLRMKLRMPKFSVLMALGSIILGSPVLGYCHFPEMQPRPFVEEKEKEYKRHQEDKQRDKKEKKYEEKKKEGRAKEKDHKKHNSRSVDHPDAVGNKKNRKK